MNTRIIFNVPSELKKSAMAKAKEEGDTLTGVLSHTLQLYSQGLYDPDDFLSKEDLESIERRLADMKAGRVVPVESLLKEFKT